VKRNIEEERIKLENYLLQELTDQLYTIVTKSVLETGTVMPTREASFKRRFRNHLNTTNSATNNSDTVNSTDVDSISSSPESQIDRLIQAASKLNNTREANVGIVEKIISDINKNMTNQLISMVNTTSNHVVESNLIDNTKLLMNFSNKNSSRQLIENNPKFLCQLIDLSFEQFRTMAKYYKHFIDYSSKINQQKYNSNIVWTSIQTVLIQLLDEYLDIKQAGQQSVMTQSEILERLDVNSFFAKKRLLNLNFTTELVFTCILHIKHLKIFKFTGLKILLFDPN
jgi:hypothetical protein